ncbi:MAG: oligosaccharide flippase family protein [Bacillota bacterium]|nr:oligosaccharide flippase family protein [Bacillota bacterium]
MKNQLKIGSVLTYLNVFLNIVVSLFLSPLTVSSLGQAQYGLYQLVWSTVGYMAVMDFGLTNSVVRYIAKYREKRDKRSEENFLSMVFIIYGVITLIVLAAGAALYFNLQNIFARSLSTGEITLARRLFVIMLFNMTMQIILNVFPAVINAYERFMFQRSLTIVRLILRTALLTVLLLSGFQSMAIALMDTSFTVIFFVIQIVYVFIVLKVRVRLNSFDTAFFKEVFSYSFFVFLAMIVDQVNWKVDQFIIGQRLGASDVAVYSIALQFPYYYMSFAGAISGVFLPAASKMAARGDDDDRFTDLMIKTGRAQWFVLGIILLGFMAFGKQFLLLWMGDNFAQGYPIALMLMLALTIPLFQSVGISVQQAKRKHAFRSYVLLAMAVINVILTYIFVGMFGMIGAAVGTVISFILGNIVAMNVYYKKALNIDLKRFFTSISKGMLMASVITVLIGIVINMLPVGGWVGLGIKIAIFALTYLYVFGIVGLDKYEKEQYLGGIKRALKR